MGAKPNCCCVYRSKLPEESEKDSSQWSALAIQDLNEHKKYVYVEKDMFELWNEEMKMKNKGEDPRDRSKPARDKKAMNGKKLKEEM